MVTPSEPAVRAWIALVRAHARAFGQVEAALKAADLPPLEWYDVLWELERAGPLRPRELQGRLLLAQYNLSRLLERMRTAGLVEHRACPEDRRGFLVAATELGLQARRRMWPTYAAAIEAAVGLKLNGEDLSALAELLGALARPGPSQAP